MVTMHAASGSFQAVGANSARSNDTRIVAGRVNEKNKEEKSSAGVLFGRREKRRNGTKTEKAMKGEGGEEKGEEDKRKI